MNRMLRLATLSALTLLLVPAAAWAQYLSEPVGFNGPPIDDPATSQEMFQIPQWSGSTSAYVVPNSANYDHNAAYRAAGLHTEGAAAETVYFDWVDTADPDGWLRLTTGDGPLRPNPGVHTAGQVRFKITNRSEIFDGEIGILIGIRETGAEVPQMYDGGTAGEIEWVGVDPTPNGIVVGPNYTVDTTAIDDDIQVYPVGTDIGPDGLDLPLGTAVIEPGPDGVLDTTPTPDDEVRFGYVIGANGNRVPLPAVVLPPRSTAYSMEWDLGSGGVIVDGTSHDGGIAGFTGNGSFEVTRGVLEHIAFVNVPSDPAIRIEVGIDEMQFEAPDPDPTVPPTVVSPIIAGQTAISVTDLMYSADQVTLYRDGSPVGSMTPTWPEDVEFTVAPAQEGQIFTATQRNGQDGSVSGPSAGVEVLAGPPTYSFALLMDETGGGSCPGYAWEWVGVTDVSGYDPSGQPLFTNDGLWQTVDIPFDDPQLVYPGAGGNGVLDPSPTGYWTIDSIWFTLEPNQPLGPWEVFVDRVELIDSFGEVGEVILDMEDGVNRLGRARGQSPDELGLISSQLSNLAYYDGTTSQRIAFEYDGVAPESIGMLQRIQYNCGTSQLIDDTSTAIRFHLLLRAQPTAPDVPQPEIVTPMIAGNQTTVRVLCDAGATSVQLYIDGDEYGTPVTPSDGYADFFGVPLAPGLSISATQDIPVRATSDLAYPAVVSDRPLPPVVTAPILPDSTSVTVTVLDAPYATADQVIVYVNDIERGQATPSGATVTVNISGSVVNGDAVTAVQSVNGALSDESAPVYVGFPAPVMYKAPAAGDTSVRVMALTPGAESVKVVVNELTEYSAAVSPGASYVDVPVMGLAAGDSIVAYQTALGVDSDPSAYEIVTTSVSTAIKCDDFEYDQTAYEAAWGNSGYTRLELVDTMNSTPGGQKSLYAMEGQTRVDSSIEPLIPTETDPVVVNVNIYDNVGVGNPAVQFIQLTGDLVAGDWFLMEVGILGWADTDNVHYDLRVIGNGGPNWVDLDQYDAPDRSIGWHNLTVVHKGNRIDAYVDGRLSYKNLALIDPTTYQFPKIGAAPYASGSAYYDDFCVEVGPVRFNPTPPPSPSIVAPIVVDDDAVTVSNVALDATLVQVFDQSLTEIGSYTGPIDPSGEVELTLTRPLVFQERITAKVTNPNGDATSEQLEVGDGNGDILVCIGIRETGDTGALGSPGSTSGDYEMEWVGAATEVDGAPQGTPISPSNQWRTLEFDPVAGPVLAVPGLGDGSITATRGTLEHLAVAVNAGSADRSSGPYEVYVDNVVNVGAGSGGSDFVITDFEGYTPPTEVLFQEPTYSGTTGADLAPLPSASEVSAAAGNPGQSELLVWFFKDTTSQRWARITTAGTGEVPSPIIDLTRPIRLDLLLVTGVQTTPGDLNCDGAVNFDDIDPFVLALTGQAAYEAAYPDCNWFNADCNLDGSVNFDDIDGFVTLLAGGGGK